MGVRSTERATELLRRQEVLAKFGELALRSDDLEEILTEACSLVGEALGTDLSKVMELQEDDITLLVRSGVGWKPGVVGEVTVKAVKGSSEGHALQTGKAVTSADIETETRFTYADFLKDNGVRALVNVIIHGAEGERPYGILEVDSRSPRAFTEDDVSFLRGYANLLAGAVARFDLLKQARIREHALKESEDHARAAIDLNPQMPWAADPQGNVTEVSPRWAALTGLSAEESLGTRWGRLVHPDELPAMSAAWRRSVATGDPLDVEARVRTEDGSYRWLRVRAFPRRDARGAIVRWYGTTEDIQERRDLADALRGWNETLERRVAERTEERDRTWRLTQDLLVVVGRDGTLLSVNAAWTTALGWREDELLGRSFAEFTHPDDLDATLAAFAGIFEAPLAEPYEYRLLHRDGGYRRIAWTAAFEAGHVYASGRDNTDQREKEAALAQAEEKLRQSQKMEAVGQLTGGLAHDFNNLLTGISGALDLMQRRIAQGRTADIERYVTIALTSANRAAALTHRLLAFSRRQTLDPKVVEVNRLVAGMEDMVRRTVGPAVAIGTTLTAGVGPVLVDPNQLENALLNLCINARDAMPGGGNLSIVTASVEVEGPFASQRDMAPGPYVTLSVSDTGSGMPPDVVARAFDPFFTTKPLGEGTGLGLSMIYGFAKQSGGQARIHSQVGVGTTVTLYLPRHHGEAAPSVPGEHDALQRAEVGETVLVVDDEPAIRMLVTDVLQDLGYRAIEAVDGKSGLRQVETHPGLDLIVTDVGMPGGMNGRQLADAARVLRPGLKVLFITGFAESVAVGGDALEPGMQLLTKPFTIEALTTRVHAMLSDA